VSEKILDQNLSEKIPKKEIIIKEFSEIKNVYEEIKRVQSNKESVYNFSSGTTAEFLYERSCVNDLSFNCFQIYNENIYYAFKKIKEMLQEICNFHKIDVTKNKYYLTSEILEEFLEDYKYDFGGIRIPVFGGYWILECNNAQIIVDDKQIDVMPGTIVLFEAGRKISFKNVDRAISFNISTLNKIKNQYPQKWMPI
jgi:hypothetical protein